MRLGFYLNPVTRLRTEKDQGEPDPVLIASLAEMAGADIILVGWNPGGGLIRERDVKLIREIVRNDLIVVVPSLAEYIDLVVRAHPTGVVLLPADWDGVKPALPVQFEIEGSQLDEIITGYKSAGVPTSVFIEPDVAAIKACARANVGGVVLDCSKYAKARSDEEAQSAHTELENAALAADKFGLVICFAHGLHYRNLAPIAALPYGEELYVGQAIASRSVINGLDRAIRDMKTIIFRSRVKD